jgi:two-component system LytT family sensor kinase
VNKRFFRVLFSIDSVALAVLFASALYPLSWPFALPTEAWIKQGVEHFLFGIFYFANLLFFFPKFSEKGRRLTYFLCIVASIITIVLSIRGLASILNLDAIMAKVFSTAGHPFHSDHSFEIKWLIFLCTIVWGVSYVSAVAKKLQKNQLAFEVSEKERVSAELSFLKAQINPHFFFNTLHTIYSLMDTDQPSAKSSIYRLSHMMRYVIYETKNDMTSLFKEISFIEDYIELMKVRIAGDVQIIFDRQPGLHDMQVAPMLFLPFVENAFKHGISAVKPSYVLIDITETNDHLNFEIRNPLYEDLGKQLEDGEGIGIANTRRRLDLLYPGKYELTVDKDMFSREFSVSLTLFK